MGIRCRRCIREWSPRAEREVGLRHSHRNGLSRYYKQLWSWDTLLSSQIGARGLALVPLLWSVTGSGLLWEANVTLGAVSLQVTSVF